MESERELIGMAGISDRLGPEWVIGEAGIGDRLGPEWVIGMAGIGDRHNPYYAFGEYRLWSNTTRLLNKIV